MMKRLQQRQLAINFDSSSTKRTLMINQLVCCTRYHEFQVAMRGMFLQHTTPFSCGLIRNNFKGFLTQYYEQLAVSPSRIWRLYTGNTESKESERQVSANAKLVLTKMGSFLSGELIRPYQRLKTCEEVALVLVN
ncbi:hypothetical protein GOBAR_DD28858 [Gossypium barbadense]|nr:hypothetical protein GOBAR_DD28858 [Gossypium barbadense]